MSAHQHQHLNTLTMSYIDAIWLRDSDTVHVVERRNGQRIFTDWPARYVFYYDDPGGKHRTINPETGGWGEVVRHEVPCADRRGGDLKSLGQPLPKGENLIGGGTPDRLEMTLRIKSQTVGRDRSIKVDG